MSLSAEALKNFMDAAATTTRRLWSLSLTLPGPLVWLQHQVLFGLFQLFLQTLVLGSDFADPLLPVLQQAKLGAYIHHLLMGTERTCSFFCVCVKNVLFFFLNHLYNPGTCCCATCFCYSRGFRVPFIYT